jgi:ribose 5-phosphate isomerase A
MTLEEEKLEAARYAAGLVEPGVRVGLGTGTTVAHLLPALAGRDLGLRCVATSVATEELARSLGLAVEPFSELEELDIAIDGADQIAPDGWLTKGGGRAHTREKLVAAAARRFVVIASGDKVVERITAPVALELFSFGLAATLRRLGDEVRVREGPLSPDGGVIADYWGGVGDPGELACHLESEPGVSGHGLFPPSLVTDVVVARGGSLDHRTIGP